MYAENYQGQAKAERQSKSSVFNDAISNLTSEVFQLEEMVSRIVGRVTDTIGGNSVSPPEPSPCPAVVINQYPDKLRELKERIQKARLEIIDALF